MGRRHGLRVEAPRLRFLENYLFLLGQFNSVIVRYTRADLVLFEVLLIQVKLPENSRARVRFTQSFRAAPVYTGLSRAQRANRPDGDDNRLINGLTRLDKPVFVDLDPFSFRRILLVPVEGRPQGSGPYT